MNKFITITLGLLLSLGAMQASAETISKNAAFVTDYVWRGLSQTDNGVALQAGADYQNKNAYASVWVSNVEDGNGAEGLPLEMDVSFGYNNQFKKFNLDMRVTTYNYLHNNTQDLTEFRIATSPLKGLEVALNREIKVQYWYPEVSYEKFLPHRLYLDLSAGFWSYDGGESAITARAELARDFPEFHHIDVFAAITYISDKTVFADDNISKADSVLLLGIRKRF
jgi:uncharacterized protein (TIGR02001 family)